jgi:hypothetical protein
MSIETRFSISELVFLKKELEENKYAKDSMKEMRRTLIEKIENIIQRKVEGPKR